MTDDVDARRRGLRVIGGSDARATRGTMYVCTWCGLRYKSRAELDAHRLASVECRANQKVSSPLQTRYGDADMVWTQPGEGTLHRVRSRTCPHTHPRARLVDSAGATIGFQCGWCYSLLPDDLPGD